MHNCPTAVWRLILVFNVAWLLAGCGTQIYRTEVGPAGKPCQLDAPQKAGDGRWLWESENSTCAKAWAVRSPQHGVNYVEIDEQGIIGNRGAMEDALAFAGQPSATGEPAYVVVFVHGWHHNGAPDDGNVQAFHSALEALKSWHPNSDVRGIFVSWRGDSLPVPGLRYLTFWDRKSTSDEVGRGGLLEFLLRLERAVKPLATPAAPVPPSANKLVLIGHSFGASVTFNALAHVYMERFIDGVYSTAQAPRFRGYGDLVVLINPAIEAMRYMPFQTAINYYASRPKLPRADFRYDLVPRLVILSSQGDWATRIAFPAARFFSMALEKHDGIGSGIVSDPQKDISEWVLDRDTIGNRDNLHSHWPLHIVTRPTAAKVAATGAVTEIAERDTEENKSLDKPQRDSCTRLSKIEINQRLSSVSTDDPILSKEAGSFLEFPDSHIQLARRESPIALSPYVLAFAGKELIADHTQIDSKNLICWIDQLVSGE